MSRLRPRAACTKPNSFLAGLATQLPLRRLDACSPINSAHARKRPPHHGYYAVRHLREAARLRRAAARRGVREIGQKLIKPTFSLALAAPAPRGRYWSAKEKAILAIQTNLATSLRHLGRHDEALALKREIHARRVVIHGVSDERASRPAAVSPSL